MQGNGTNTLSRNFNQVFKNFLFEDRSWQQNIDQTNEFVFDSDLKGLSKLWKAYPNNSTTGYLITNYLKEKTICVSKDV